MRTTLLRVVATAAMTFGVMVAGAAASQAAITPTPGPTGQANDDPVLEQLEDLVSTQSDTEIEAIVSAPGPADVLVDSATGEYIAAVAVTTPQAQPLAITPIYAGCGSSANACAWTNYGASPIGFSGTGKLKIKLNNVTRVYAGAYNTTFSSSSAGYHTIYAYKTFYFSAPLTFTQISR
ncbi:hypothetical protein OEB99_16940 [Actinotalea sp. M2MS4P-6]|uniref:hypothetical protein n=1 Tax=Actinotalea sp. M2MS4P-6 TaxID=2983762 RepID=UPI0021E48CF3|nr:hypothetical protein [Actinotalea sp. M2MS4P-6]MCV2396002.1 hypothetical protein [Actinotalea sp. M2MS4P-6]